ncbi:MAG: exodeoxyribonuclease III [Patescibacteria group bacterium]|nr:exodeoxyribonuclease III [Patescibacteria group bacterium]
MKIISWNVNGIRAVAKKGFAEFMAIESPDILCIQEPKAFEEQFQKELGDIPGYKYVWHSGTRAGYAGTAIFYKESVPVIDTQNHFEEVEHFHTDGRMTQIETPDFVLLNGYFPNGGTRADGTEMLTYKLEFYDHIIHYSNKLVAEGKNVIITGDLNIVHTEIDIARPKENKNTIGFLPVERAKVGELLDNGYTDMFRHFYPEQIDTYSWWSYRAGARARNVGWRIDYFVLNNSFVEQAKDITYMTDVMGSDHCPVMLELK